jgi:hypothetical protein
MHILGFVFIITTTLVLFLKKEEDNSEDPKLVKEDGVKHNQLKNYEDNLSTKSTYLLMWELLRIVPVKKLIVILLTMKVS